MPTFHHNLLGTGKLCNHGCKVLFDSNAVTVFSKYNQGILLKGWQDTTGAKLWRFSLCPEDHPITHPSIHPAAPATLTSLNAHDLPSVGALIHYLHAAAAFPVKSTWISAIKACNFSTWPGLTYTNASNYFPASDETIKGHLTQSQQGVRSTKADKYNLPTPPAATIEEHPKSTPTRELHIWVKTISTLYTDDTGRFPIRSRISNQYLMVAYHCDTNTIIIEPFHTREDCHHIPAYTHIMTCLKNYGHVLDHQVLNKEASKEYRLHVTDIWKANYQLVPPNVHHRNIAERAIHTFKSHFLSILAGIPSYFPNYLWDKILPKTELSLNLLRQSTISPLTSAWVDFNGPFNFDATPLGPIVCHVLIHNKTSTRSSWAFRARDVFYVGPALKNYRCFQVVGTATKSILISDTADFRHD